MTPFDRLFAVMIKPSVVVLYVGLVILSFLYLDQPIANYFHNVDVRTNLSIINWITKLGMGIVYVPALFLLACFFRYQRVNKGWEARSWFLLMCVVIPGSICGFIKVILGRARPDMWFDGQFYGFYGFHSDATFWSFPSGHTSVIMGITLGLSVLFPRHFYTLLLAGLTVASTRIVLTHHYLSDVLSAFYLTVLEIGVLLCILRRKSWLAPALKHTYNCVLLRDNVDVI